MPLLSLRSKLMVNQLLSGETGEIEALVDGPITGTDTFAQTPEPAVVVLAGAVLVGFWLAGRT
jgi:hypothetical protein